MSKFLTAVVLLMVASLNVSAQELSRGDSARIARGEKPRLTYTGCGLPAATAESAISSSTQQSGRYEPRKPGRIEDALELSVSKEIMGRTENADKVYRGSVPSTEHTYATVAVWVQLNPDGSVASLELMRTNTSGHEGADAFPMALETIRRSAPYKIKSDTKTPKFVVTFIFKKGSKKFKMRALDEG